MWVGFAAEEQVPPTIVLIALSPVINRLCTVIACQCDQIKIAKCL